MICPRVRDGHIVGKFTLNYQVPCAHRRKLPHHRLSGLLQQWPSHHLIMSRSQSHRFEHIEHWGMFFISLKWRKCISSETCQIDNATQNSSVLVRKSSSWGWDWSPCFYVGLVDTACLGELQKASLSCDAAMLPWHITLRRTVCALLSEGYKHPVKERDEWQGG